ncbi:MAG: ChbG/HpnK family deacetylase [Rubrivivax sp.]
MTRVLALCADDFGAGAAIDEAIVALVRQGRLSEVSCISNGPSWAAGAAALMAVPAVQEGRVRVGLHWNLTEGRPASPALAAHWPRLPALPRLIALAHLGRLPLAALRAELDAQWQSFERHAGQPPAHLDGHQHVHHLPGLRRLVQARALAQPALRVRDTGRVRGPGFGVKRALIAATGGCALGRWLRAQGRGANRELLGVYDFRDPDYRGLMRRWLARLPPAGGLIFCHPALAEQPGDPIAAARCREWAYLAGEDFAADLAAAGVSLAGRQDGPRGT